MFIRLVPVVLNLSLFVLLASAAVLPRHARPELGSADLLAQNHSIDDMCSRDTDCGQSYLTKRVPPYVNTKDCMETGFQLTRLTWADEAAAEGIYERWMKAQGLEANKKLKAPPMGSFSDMRAYWTWQASDPRWVNIFQGQEFQSAYRYICPHPTNVLAAHYFVTWKNGKAGKGSSSLQDQKIITNAEFVLVFNMLARIMVIQEAKSPLAQLKDLRPDLSSKEAESLLPNPHHGSDILFAALRSEVGVHAYKTRWKNFGFKEIELAHVMGKLENVIVASTKMPEKMLLAVQQCVYQHSARGAPNTPVGSLPSYPGVTIPAGSSCFYTILGCGTNKMVGWMLASHKENPGSVQDRNGLGHMTLTSVQVFTTDTGPEKRPTFVWSLAKYTPALEQAAVAEEGKPVENVFGIELPRPAHTLEEHEGHRGKNLV